MTAATWGCCLATRGLGELLTRGDVCHVHADRAAAERCGVLLGGARPSGSGSMRSGPRSTARGVVADERRERSLHGAMLLIVERNGVMEGRVEERRVAGRGRWLIRRFRNRAAGRVPWVRFLPPLSEPGGPISGTGLSSGIMRLAHGLPGHDQQTGLASPGTRLAPLRRPAGASSGLLTPWRRRPLGSSPSLVHVMTSGIPAHLRGDRPSATPVSLLPSRHRFHLRSLPSAGIARLPRYLRTSPPP